MYNRISIVGGSGTGKSTLCDILAKKLNLPAIHLDAINFEANWVEIDKNKRDKIINERANEDKWIIDGNYQKTLELRINECDTIFLLDFPTQVCLEGAKSRIGQKREDLPWVEEKLDENFKQCIINFTNEKLPQIYKLLDKYKMNHSIFIFKSRDEADNYIRNMEKKYANI